MLSIHGAKFYDNSTTVYDSHFQELFTAILRPLPTTVCWPSLREELRIPIVTCKLEITNSGWFSFRRTVTIIASRYRNARTARARRTLRLLNYMIEGRCSPHPSYQCHRNVLLPSGHCWSPLTKNTPLHTTSRRSSWWRNSASPFPPSTPVACRTDCTQRRGQRSGTDGIPGRTGNPECPP